MENKLIIQLQKGFEVFMIKLAIVATVSFIFGFIISMLIFKKKNTESALIKLLLDFKNTIEDYKLQNTLNSAEVKTALKDAGHLAKVLTTNQNLKGKFGEDCLENVIKSCFPNINSDYFKQIEAVNEDGVKIKPDYLIKLPNNRNIIVDCKINLEKYIEYKDSIGSAQEESLKSEFIKDINSTINSLSNKKYETAQNINQPEFILMYIPLETVLTQLYTDKDFISVIKNAAQKNIIIVGNSSIITVIKLVNLLWAQDKQNNNVEKIVACAESIYNIVAEHSQLLYSLKATLTDCTDRFNKEYEKLSNNSKLFKYTEELKGFGIEINKKSKINKKECLSINSEFLE